MPGNMFQELKHVFIHVGTYLSFKMWLINYADSILKIHVYLLLCEND